MTPTPFEFHVLIVLEILTYCRLVGQKIKKVEDLRKDLLERDLWSIQNWVGCFANFF